MRYYFLIAGILCILYYLVLVFYSRRLRSTFAVFWVITGGVHLVFGCAPFSASVYSVLKWLCLFCWAAILLVESRIIRAIFAKCDEELDWLIVLGAQVRGTHITNSLRRRLDSALEYQKKHPGVKVIVSGGQGPGEAVTEADAMAEYLIENGVPEEQIRREDRSTSTRENLRFSRKFADAEQDRVGIVTNDFHIYRSSVIARQEGYRKLYMIPADSNPVFQINYLAREFFGVVYVWVKGK